MPSTFSLILTPVQFLTLPAITLLTAAVAFVTNWVELIPWRRSRDLHWTERARLLYPARIAARLNLWQLPAIVTMAAILWLPDNTPHWALLLLFSAIGALLGTISMEHEAFPRLNSRTLLRLAVFGWITRFLLWSVLIAAAAAMPDDFNLQCLLIGAAVVAFLVLWNKKGKSLLARYFGRRLPVPERLQNIVRDTSTRMNISYKQVLVGHSPFAQAYASPPKRCLIFTDRLLEILTDDELAAVTAHELGHLAETPNQWRKRYVVWFGIPPWIFINPALKTFGPLSFIALITITAGAVLAFRRVSHAQEIRADTAAHANELNPGAYARALIKLHEDSLTPAVGPKERATHPSLYDRIIAAGVTPDFPRPRPATAVSMPGFAVRMIFAILAVFLIAHHVDMQAF